MADPELYRLGNNGYMVHRQFPDRYMHRDMWEAERGPIPPDHHIHHKNKDRTDNRIENLECIEKHAHMRLHGITFAIINAWERRKARTRIHTFECISCGKEGLSHRLRARFCSRDCAKKYNNWLHGVYLSVKRLRMKKDLACPICATAFTQRSNLQITCSKKCTVVRSNRMAAKKQKAAHG